MKKSQITAPAKHKMATKIQQIFVTKDTPVFAAAGPGSPHKTAGRGRDLGPAAASAYTSPAQRGEGVRKYSELI